MSFLTSLGLGRVFSYFIGIGACPFSLHWDWGMSFLTSLGLGRVLSHFIGIGACLSLLIEIGACLSLFTEIGVCLVPFNWDWGLTDCEFCWDRGLLLSPICLKNHCFGILFISSPEHEVLMVSYCSQWLSVVRRRASSVVRRVSTFDVYTLETTFVT